MKLFSRIVSVVCHPVFLPTWVIALLLYLSPELFFGLDQKQQLLRVITVAYTTVTFPLLTVFLLWRLGFIENMYMRDQRERYVPLIASMLFYFWVFWIFHKQFQAHQALQVFLLAVFLSTVLTFLVNLFSKVSMHTAAFGLLSAFSVYLAWHGITNAIVFVVLSILLCGVVAMVRLYLKEHTPPQVYTGMVLGVLALLLSIPVIKLIS
ncbi:MAG: hypothetical protein JNM95_06800 [Chitinophagaceae bacterium]|nr:hypothetical protein [Chitinophagaceae bacterium]